MAAQEFSFGPSLSRPVGAPPRGSGGGYIPVADIPNMPRADVTMPLAQYPDIPSIRYKYQEGAPDMAGRIAALQQKALPGGFAEGAERITRSAGKGQEAMGEAISKGSSQLSRALSIVGNTFAEITEEANRQKAVADGSRESNAWEMAEATFLARAQKEGLPPAAWWNEFQKNEGKQYNEFVGTLGANEAQQDVFRSKSISRFGGFYAKTLGEDAKESWKIDDQAMKLELNTAVINGDWDGAYGAAGRLRNSNHLTEPEYHKTLFDIGKAQDETYIQSDIKRDPAFVQEELDKVKRGESSKVYSWLKDPADVDRLYNQSKGEVNRRQIEAGSDISKDILDGTPLTEVEVVTRAKAAGLTDPQTDTLRKQAVESIPYDDGKTSTAMAAVENYDPRNDKDLKEYHRVKSLLATTTSKEVQALLLPELKGKWDDRGKTSSAQQDELDQSSKMIDQFAKNSMLYSEAGVKLPSGMGEERGEKTDIVDKEAYQANEKRRMDLRWAAREYMRQNPDFKQGELREYINGLIEPDAKQQARDAAKGTASGEKPVMRPQFIASPTGALFRPASVPRTEPLSEEALIKREQEAQKMRTPAGKSSAAIAQPGEGQIVGGGYVVPKPEPSGVQQQTYPAAAGGLSESLLSNVKDMEGLYLKAYPDFKQHSVGYGTRAKGAGETITKEEAESRLVAELSMHANRVDKAAQQVGMALTPGQRDALISFDFNTGQGDYLITSSGGNAAEIVRRMALYTKAGGKTNPGLVNRRRKEVAMFNA